MIKEALNQAIKNQAARQYSQRELEVEITKISILPNMKKMNFSTINFHLKGQISIKNVRKHLPGKTVTILCQSL
jgi:hypothetical protein